MLIEQMKTVPSVVRFFLFYTIYKGRNICYLYFFARTLKALWDAHCEDMSIWGHFFFFFWTHDGSSTIFTL